MVAYAASKAAIHGLTMAASKDLAPYNIRVNTIMPALIGPDDGFMWKRQNDLHAASGSPYFDRDPAVVARNKLSGVPLKRLGTVEEVVSSVAFLLSDDSAYVTGTHIVVAGGLA
jgi:NAD(P)-dependent dehydrogenase (short-subunit alcohol dehydrogenase family)